MQFWKSFGFSSFVLKISCIFWGLPIVLGLAGCQPKDIDGADYQVFLADPDHGFVQSRDVIHKLRITAQYLPVPFLAWQEIHKTQLPALPATYDSLKTVYQSGMTFQLTLESLDPKLDLEGLLYGKATETSEKSAIMATLDTELTQQLALETNGKTYHPSLCVRESMPGMNRKIQFLMVFPIEATALTGQSLQFRWDDVFFQTGRTALSFQVEDLQAAPEVRW